MDVRSLPTPSSMAVAAEIAAGAFGENAVELAAIHEEMHRIKAEIAAENGCTIAEVEAWLETQQ